MILRNMTIKNTELGSVVDALKQRNLSVAFELLENYGYRFPEAGIIQPLNDIKADYALMTKYWKRGYKESKLDELVAQIQQRIYRLTANTYLQHILLKNTIIANLRNTKTSSRDWSVATVRSEMENFTAELALLELEPQHKQERHRTELYAQHTQLLNDFFDHILLSPQWSDSMHKEMLDMLLSPTIDINDRMLIASGIMLSLILIFDFNKWKTLVNVYCRETDEQLRQRALVGWVTTLDDQYSIFAEQSTIFNYMIKDENVVEELTVLQMQMVYCANAENDNRIIRDEIMPDLIKHGNLHITPNGIEEKEDSSLEDILDSSASERKMADMEEKLKRMTDMQKSGADIYFGGFSQMKRFPFFDRISNWFAPFDISHPAISELYAKQTDIDVVRMIVDGGSFCDSDKYSFALAFQKAVNQMPANMREMLSSGNIHMGMENKINKEERGSRAYIRQMYLQNVYRFFKLYPSRDLFHNPFDDMLFCKEITSFCNLTNKVTEIAALLIKRQMLTEAAAVLNCHHFDVNDYNLCMLCAYINTLLPQKTLQKFDRIADTSPLKWYELALNHNPDSIKALFGYGRELMKTEDNGNSEKAASIFRKLLAIDPNNAMAMLNHAECLLVLGKFDEAQDILYRLNFEYPDNSRVIRLLARVHMLTRNIEIAKKLYDRLPNSNNPLPSDDICIGILAWCEGDVQNAVILFTKYLNTVYPSASIQERFDCGLKDIIEANNNILSLYSIDYTDINLMLNIISVRQPPL